MGVLMMTGLALVLPAGAIVVGLITQLFIILAGFLILLDFGWYGFLYYLSVLLELVGIYLAKYGRFKAGAYTPLR